MAPKYPSVLQLMNMAEGMMGGGNRPQGQGGYQEGGQGNGGTDCIVTTCALPLAS